MIVARQRAGAACRPGSDRDAAAAFDLVEHRNLVFLPIASQREVRRRDCHPHNGKGRRDQRQSLRVPAVGPRPDRNEKQHQRNRQQAHVAQC